MAKNSLDHVCILVKDIDQALDHYRSILRAAAPDLLKQKVEKQEQLAGEDRYVTAVFKAPRDGCNIQLIQPLNPESALYQRLQRHGEHIHHLGFASPQLDETFRRLKENGVAVRGDQFNVDQEHPGIRWQWILPTYAHGALIEVMDA